MKKIISIILCCVFCFSLASCGVKEAKSDTDAKRIVISVFSDLSEISKQLDEDYISSMNMKKIEKRLDKCLADIHSVDRYKSLDNIKDDYDKALKLHNKVYNKWNKKYTEIIEIEKGVKK